jgi:hypothetical protein
MSWSWLEVQEPGFLPTVEMTMRQMTMSQRFPDSSAPGTHAKKNGALEDPISHRHRRDVQSGDKHGFTQIPKI